MRRLLLLLPLALALAACGSSSSLYVLAKTRACLEKKGLRVQPVTARVDFVASNASAGALRANFSRHEVTISFGADAAEVARIAAAYRRFHGKNIGIEDILEAKRNVVLLWQTHPSDADHALVFGCLK